MAIRTTSNGTWTVVSPFHPRSPKRGGRAGAASGRALGGLPPRRGGRAPRWPPGPPRGAAQVSRPAASQGHRSELAPRGWALMVQLRRRLQECNPNAGELSRAWSREARGTGRGRPGRLGRVSGAHPGRRAARSGIPAAPGARRAGERAHGIACGPPHGPWLQVDVRPAHQVQNDAPGHLHLLERCLEHGLGPPIEQRPRLLGVGRHGRAAQGGWPLCVHGSRSAPRGGGGGRARRLGDPRSGTRGLRATGGVSPSGR